ncbi:hypothetical protein C8Q74DRAFT_1221121 [Fomes fomentarius]|nr:hypothetical protein C8Q74DRAFT_1221121 [Fomes fomentarius]
MAHKPLLIDEDEYVKCFLELPKHFDPSRCPKPIINANPFKGLENAQNCGMLEAQISATMTAAINRGGLVPGLVMALAENAPLVSTQTVDDVEQRIDAALFPQTIAPNDNRPHWADQLVPIEFMQDPIRHDLFNDKEDDIDSDALDRKRFWSQIVHYSELIYSAQHRVHLLMILIMGRKCRLLRWDRSGVIVSRAFDYYEKWAFLCDVLWRISVLAHVDPASLLGEDPSAKRLSSTDPAWALMDEAAEPNADDVDHCERILIHEELSSKAPVPWTFKYVRAMFRESLQEVWPRYQLEILRVSTPLPSAGHDRPGGTRGYVALEVDEDGVQRFRWLKDAWRVDYEGVSLEGAILKRLNEAGVEFVPTLVCHGVIQSQRTKTPDFWEMLKNSPRSDAGTSTSRTLVQPDSGSTGSKRKHAESDTNDEIPLPLPQILDEESAFRLLDDCPLRRHVHYRMVVAEVCMPLSMFATGHQLVSIIIDCVTAHYMASQEGVLHRDVGGGNILIYPVVETTFDEDSGEEIRELRWAGILTDWELSKNTMDGPTIARQPERTGTWQYLSVAILLNRFKVAEIPDDLESFLYVLLYYAIRYLRSNCKDTDVGHWIEDFFDSYGVDGGSYICGRTKCHTVQAAAQLTLDNGEILSFGRHMDGLFRSLLRSFKAYYAVTLYDESKPLPSHSGATCSLADSSPSPPSQSPTELARRYRRRLRVKLEKPMARAEEPAAYVPSANERAMAGNVRDHQGLLAVLSGAMVSSGWPLDDKVGDRVLGDWISKTPVGGPSVVSATPP